MVNRKRVPLSLKPESRKCLLAAQPHPRPSAKTNEKKLRLGGSLHSHTWRKQASALCFHVLPTSRSSIRTYIKIMTTCSPLSTSPIKPTNKKNPQLSEEEQMAQVRWHSDACKRAKVRGENGLLYKVFRHRASDAGKSQGCCKIPCSKSKPLMLPPSIWYSSFPILLSPWHYQLETDTLNGFRDLRFHYSALTNYKRFAKYLMFSLAESPCLMG